MRILMTTDTIGGVWTFAVELTNALLRRGCAVCLASIGTHISPWHQEWCGRMQSQWQQLFRHETVDAPLEWMQDNEGAYTDAEPRLVRLAQEFRPDVLHTSQFCFGALPIEVSKIITAHSDVISWAQSCRGGPLQSSEWLTRYFALVTTGLREADIIAAPTRWMAESLANTFGLPQTPVVIHNGRSVPPVPVTTCRKLQAVSAGRLWDEAKNISLLTDVRSPMPVFLAGDTRQGSACMHASFTDVNVLGSLASEELLTLFRESAIYICTSQYEPFGLAPLEAALCGCAVLAYDIPSLREVWGSAALYFNGIESLTNLLRQFCVDPQLLAVAQRRSGYRARTFTADRMASAYLQLYLKAKTAREDIAYAS